MVQVLLLSLLSYYSNTFIPIFGIYYTIKYLSYFYIKKLCSIVIKLLKYLKNLLLDIEFRILE